MILFFITIPIFTYPPGDYTIQVTDACGRSMVHNITVAPMASPPEVYIREGCAINSGGLEVFAFVPIQSVQITVAPTAFANNLPFTLNPLIYQNSNNNYFIGHLPPGYYELKITICGTDYLFFGTIEGYQQQTIVDVIENCGSFDIDLNHTSNNTNSTPSFWLQKRNPLTNGWMHPLTGAVYLNGSLPGTTTAIELTNQTINYNFAFTGDFRILKTYAATGIGTFDACVDSIYEFTFTGQPKFNDVYSFSCNNGTYDAIVDAVGVAPLIYRIIEKNGAPFVIQNANSPIFLGIPPAHYKFQIEDACGNILNSEFDVPSPIQLIIAAQNLCDGQPGSLTLPNFSLLQYQWWKGSNSTTVLSTTNSLQFTSFNSAADAGVYHVRVRYTGNPNSCVDFILNYTISPNGTVNAGDNNAVAYCGNQPVIDLNTLLTGTFDNNGNWQETTTSGMLINNLWDATAVVPGIYQFQYRVDGACGVSDTASIAITINGIPQVPTASVSTIACDAGSLQLFASTVPNATYEWTGPNAFVSTVQNPVIDPLSAINNGIYSVKAIQNGCDSAWSTVNVTVAALPEFTLAGRCIGRNFTLEATPVQNSFDPETATYAWSGPDNFISTENPVVLFGQPPGNYTLDVTNAEGCTATRTIAVAATFCEIPNFISPNDDEYNQSFNLTGLDVEKLQIYNRWGRLVYEKDNYTNQWHGQNMHDDPLPDSTYYYSIQLKSQAEKHGWIFLAAGK